LTPTLERFLAAVPVLKKAVASPTGDRVQYFDIAIAGDNREAA
jgi:hypothetical protein